MMKPYDSEKYFGPPRTAKAVFSFMLLTLTLLFGLPDRSYGRAVTDDPVMETAVMSEAIINFQPVNTAVVFSLSLEEVYCFTSFDPVPVKTHIFHQWYKKDQLIFTRKLSLNPPKWSSMSSMKLRGGDKGPWRVDILNNKLELMKTLRFSITE